jgi:hypothetical protein
MKKKLIVAIALIITLFGFISCEHNHHDEYDPKATPLTFHFYGMGGKVVFENAPASLKYSINGGRKHVLGQGNNTIEVGDDQTVSLYLSRPKGDGVKPLRINCTGSNCYVYGNVMSLYIEDGFEKRNFVYDFAFLELFLNNENIDIHPEYELYLPATTLANFCYADMFHGCSNLTRAPELPATTLEPSCYANMFLGCKKLAAVPDIPATELAPSCCYNMFSECESLKTAADLVLKATNLPMYCYLGMFSGCTNLAHPPKILAEKVGGASCQYMFSRCANLEEAPELNAMTLGVQCYGTMFSGCKKLKKAPKLPATKLAELCYESMFSTCDYLTEAPDLPAEVLEKSCYTRMFEWCERLEKAPAIAATTVAESSCEKMFTHCHNLKESPVLHAQNLVSNCYAKMFNECRVLEKITCLATTKASSSTTNWVEGVDNNSGKLVVPASGMEFTWESGNSGLRDGWTIETYNP